MTTRQRRRTSWLSTERERLEIEWSAARNLARPASKPPVHVPTSHSSDTGNSRDDDRGVPPARVLVVEDEESFVDALTVNLEREGFSVTVARDGVEALERFAADQPDLVLLDVMLPGCRASTSAGRSVRIRRFPSSWSPPSRRSSTPS